MVRKLEPDVLSFLRRASQLLDAPAGGDVIADDEVRRSEVVETVVGQLQGHELASACHVFGCDVLQRALAMANETQCVALATPLLSSNCVLTAVTDKYASHVVEAILARLLPFAQQPQQEGEPSVMSLMASFIDALVADNARTLLVALRDRYATHVMRSTFRFLSGKASAAAESANDGKRSLGGDGAVELDSNVADAFRAGLERVADSLLALGGGDGIDEGASAKAGAGGGAVLGLAKHTIASPALQGLLTALPADSPALHALCGQLLQWPSSIADEATPAGREGAPPSQATVQNIRAMASDRIGSHVIEAVVRACPAWWRPLHAHVFRGQLTRLAGHPTATYAIQALLSAAPNAPAFGNVFKELLPALPELLRSRPAVVLRLALESAKLGGSGKELTRAVRLALAPAATGKPVDGGKPGKSATTPPSEPAAGDSSFARALLAVGAANSNGGHGRVGNSNAGDAGEDADAGGSAPAAPSTAGASPVVGGIGSRLVQALAAEPGHGTADALVHSFAALSTSELLALSRHAPGSKALEAVLNSTGGASGRTRLAQNLCAGAVRLARDKCGSHVLEAAARAATVDVRGAVMESLSRIESDIRASAHGGVLLKKLRYDHWKHHRESWAKGEQRARTTAVAFADLLSDDSAPTGGGSTKARVQPTNSERTGGGDRERGNKAGGGEVAREMPRQAGSERGGTQTARAAAKEVAGSKAEAPWDLQEEQDQLDALFEGVERRGIKQKTKAKKTVRQPSSLSPPASAALDPIAAAPSPHAHVPKSAPSAPVPSAATSSQREVAPPHDSASDSRPGKRAREPKKPRKTPQEASPGSGTGPDRAAERAARLASLFGGGGGSGAIPPPAEGKAKKRKFSMA